MQLLICLWSYYIGHLFRLHAVHKTDALKTIRIREVTEYYRLVCKRTHFKFLSPKVCLRFHAFFVMLYSTWWNRCSSSWVIDNWAWFVKILSLFNLPKMVVDYDCDKLIKRDRCARAASYISRTYYGQFGNGTE